MNAIDIKSIRKARGMTQEQVGILAGMSKSQVSRMEKGTLGSPETYERVLSAMGYRIVISLEDIRRSKTMDRDYILSLLRVYYLCNKERFGIDSLGLFGSFVRNEGREDSDIDILISLKRSNLFTYALIAQQLETVFGRHVDLISSRAKLKDDFRNHVEKEVVYVS
ncbi:MAG: nucleotidyltransferase domain-containing protein [Bacteroidales bacterium]|nr:nucleotidyltransferase domain-containing protein [Bacteroidales bacterium]